MDKSNNELPKRKYILILASLGILIYFYITYEPPSSESPKQKNKPKTKQVEMIHQKKKLVLKNKTTKEDSELEIPNYILEDLIRKSIKKHFPEITFEINGKCPKNTDLDKWSSNILTGDIYCTNFIKSDLEKHNDELNFWTQQSYTNDQVIEYQQHLEGAAEPINIEFNSPYEISKINMWIDGEVVGSIEFENNLPSNFSYSNQYKEYFLKGEIFNINHDNLDPLIVLTRVTILLNEKKKVETILRTLCKKTRKQKACSIAQDFKKWDYPVSNNLIRPIIKEDLRDGLYDYYIRIWN